MDASALSASDRAIALNNMGNALVSIGEREDEVLHFEEAVVALKAALSLYSRNDSPLEWKDFKAILKRTQ